MAHSSTRDGLQSVADRCRSSGSRPRDDFGGSAARLTPISSAPRLPTGPASAAIPAPSWCGRQLTGRVHADPHHRRSHAQAWRRRTPPDRVGRERRSLHIADLTVAWPGLARPAAARRRTSRGVCAAWLATGPLGDLASRPDPESPSAQSIRAGRTRRRRLPIADQACASVRDARTAASGYPGTPSIVASGGGRRAGLGQDRWLLQFNRPHLVLDGGAAAGRSAIVGAAHRPRLNSLRRPGRGAPAASRQPSPRVGGPDALDWFDQSCPHRRTTGCVATGEESARRCGPSAEVPPSSTGQARARVNEEGVGGPPTLVEATSGTLANLPVEPSSAVWRGRVPPRRHRQPRRAPSWRPSPAAAARPRRSLPSFGVPVAEVPANRGISAGPGARALMGGYFAGPLGPADRHDRLDHETLARPVGSSSRAQRGLPADRAGAGRGRGGRSPPASTGRHTGQCVACSFSGRRPLSRQAMRRAAATGTATAEDVAVGPLVGGAAAAAAQCATLDAATKHRRQSGWYVPRRRGPRTAPGGRLPTVIRFRPLSGRLHDSKWSGGGTMSDNDDHRMRLKLDRTRNYCDGFGICAKHAGLLPARRLGIRRAWPVAASRHTDRRRRHARPDGLPRAPSRASASGGARHCRRRPDHA